MKILEVLVNVLSIELVTIFCTDKTIKNTDITIEITTYITFLKTLEIDDNLLSSVILPPMLNAKKQLSIGSIKLLEIHETPSHTKNIVVEYALATDVFRAAIKTPEKIGIKINIKLLIV